MKNKFLIGFFVLIISLPTLDWVFDISPVKQIFEKRLPAIAPSYPKGISDTKEYLKDFEKFFNDNYGFRKTLITLNSNIMDKIFNESPDARAFMGKDGWFYFDNHQSILDAVGKAELSDELVNRAVISFGKNWQLMKNKNIDYLLVIAADKATIYPEFLPDYIKRSPNGTHRADKFLNALKKKYPDFPVLDLRPLLQSAKKKETVFQKTDTHWNERGAHYAYVEMMKMLQKKNPAFVPHLRKDFKDKANEMIRGDISDIMNIDSKNLNYELESKFKIQHREVELTKKDKELFHKAHYYVHNNKNLPILFVYKDSYFADLFSFVNELFH